MNYAGRNRSTQEDFYKTAGNAAVDAAVNIAPHGWKTNFTFIWRGTDYSAEGHPYHPS